jgi:hypothetical protein
VFNLSSIVNAAFTIKLPDGVMVAQLILVQFVKVQILVGQPLMGFSRRSRHQKVGRRESGKVKSLSRASFISLNLARRTL